jgi:hypothetical protein
MRAIFPSNPILLDYITVTIFKSKYFLNCEMENVDGQAYA